jgi:hypothetical protein
LRIVGAFPAFPDPVKIKRYYLAGTDSKGGCLRTLSAAMRAALQGTLDQRLPRCLGAHSSAFSLIFPQRFSIFLTKTHYLFLI